MTHPQPPFAGPESPHGQRTPRDDAHALEALLRIAQHGIAFVDDRGRVSEWSAGAEQLFGYPARDVLGRSLSDLIAAGDHRRGFDAALSRARGEVGSVQRLFSRGLEQNGREVWLEVSIAACPADSGLVFGVVMHDMTKQALAERRLAEVERNWLDIAKNSSDVLLLLDRVGTVIFASRGVQGRTPSDSSGQNVSELLPHLAPVLSSALSTVFDTGLPFEHEGQVQAGAEAASWLWCRFEPQREDGDVARAVLSISDIGERRARDLALRRLAGVVERTKDAVLTADARGSITTWNRGAELLWGWTEQEIIGKNLTLLCPPDLLDEQLVIFGRLRDGKHVNAYDAICLAKNRRRIPVSVSVAATRNETGLFEGVSAVVRDMSHYQALQEALQAAKSTAETASQLKSEFLANMSHELRTPLNGVVGMADLLLGTRLSPEQQGFVATLLEASQALRVIVDDVLDFSKIEAGQLRIENVEFDLSALASAAVDMFRHAAQQNGTLLRFDLPRRSPLRLVGDPNRIRQVLINLLSNAVKFTRNGAVDLKLVVADASAVTASVRAEVQDTGVGISPEAQALIFQPFAQADGSITRRFGGTGLGLSICRKLMELMGGTLGFESQPGAGSRFWFEVTLGKAQSSAARRGPLPVPVVQKISERWRILVAEDNAINQKVVTAMLRTLGAEVDIAHNGQEVVEMYRAGTYDLILMDCQMPIMSGFEATEAIRRLEGAGHIPIVAMTAQAYAQDRERCARAGMDDHLAKPVTKRELQGTLAKWLRLDEAPSLAAPPGPLSPVRLDHGWLERLQMDLGHGGRELLGGLIDAFIVDFDAALGRIREASARAGWEQVGFDAHRLRSSTGSLGAPGLADLSARLEHACRQPVVPAVVTELIPGLEREFILTRDALRAFARRAVPSEAVSLASPAAATPEVKNAPSP